GRRFYGAKGLSLHPNLSIIIATRRDVNQNTSQISANNPHPSCPAGMYGRAGHIQGNFPARVCEPPSAASARFAGKFCPREIPGGRISDARMRAEMGPPGGGLPPIKRTPPAEGRDRKSTRLNYSHVSISYADFCLKKKNHYLVLL